MQIIDGYCGVPNIYADDIGEYNRSLYGTGDYVLAIGEKLGYELVSNNEVKIKDGMFLTQGRRGLIKKGTTESCVIENGLQVEKRNDLIVIEYRKDESTQVESHTLKVLKGTSGETAADPEVVTGDIGAGATLHQMPLYRVTLDGLNVTGVEQLFTIGAVAPETVDPTVATEDGFAADAKATGEALRSLNSKIASKEWKEVSIGVTTIPANSNTSVQLSEDISSYHEIRVVLNNVEKSNRHTCIESDLNLIKEYATGGSELYGTGYKGYAYTIILDADGNSIRFSFGLPCSLVAVYVR